MNSYGDRDGEIESALTDVRAIYTELAARPIHRACTLRTECCHFKLTGLTPFLTRGEALLAAQALRASGRKALPSTGTGICPLLNPKTARCLVYHARPFGCRTHFCQAAGGPYARREVLDFIRRLEYVDEKLGGNGPHPLPDALAEALETLS